MQGTGAWQYPAEKNPLNDVFGFYVHQKRSSHEEDPNDTSPEVFVQGSPRFL
jgi:hypothetical protein